ncbi:hypothetical protein E3O54_12510 [Cryobacterium sp. TMT2-4]|nr:hypothetical protein E3O54_12510 [Cryobacterium sp. TMT2-4]
MCGGLLLVVAMLFGISALVFGAFFTVWSIQRHVKPARRGIHPDHARQRVRAHGRNRCDPAVPGRKNAAALGSARHRLPAVEPAAGCRGSPGPGRQTARAAHRRARHRHGAGHPRPAAAAAGGLPAHHGRRHPNDEPPQHQRVTARPRRTLSSRACASESLMSVRTPSTCWSSTRTQAPSRCRWPPTRPCCA